MGRKKRKGVEQKPFCFYCDREFDDEKVLIQHQRARHFKCSECTRKLDTANGLVVHMLHVHKETINRVPNALPARENPDVVIHGMEGVPNDLLREKQQRLLDARGAAKRLKSAHTTFGMGVFMNQKGGMMMPPGFEAAMLMRPPPFPGGPMGPGGSPMGVPPHMMMRMPPPGVHGGFGPMGGFGGMPPPGGGFGGMPPMGGGFGLPRGLPEPLGGAAGAGLAPPGTEPARIDQGADGGAGPGVKLLCPDDDVSMEERKAAMAAYAARVAPSAA